MGERNDKPNFNVQIGRSTELATEVKIRAEMYMEGDVSAVDVWPKITGRIDEFQKITEEISSSFAFCKYQGYIIGLQSKLINDLRSMIPVKGK